MSLKDLNKLASITQAEYSNYVHQEVVLPDNFKIEFVKILTEARESVKFFKYSAIIKTSSGLTITLPNQWFYIASYFTDFLSALKEYKTAYNKIVEGINNSKDVTKNIKETGDIPKAIESKIEKYFDKRNDVDLFKKFLSDYDWWRGSKTIDRGDYFVSPILNLASVVNVSQSYIAELVNILAEHPFLVDLLKLKLSESQPKTNIGSVFKWNSFYQDATGNKFQIEKALCLRFSSSMLTKRFAILTGLSGSGKTKLALAFARWICENDSQYKIIPVGADWTNREPLFGYPNSLEQEKYILPDNGTLSLLLEAGKEENQSKPYFLILDEMNLSHVERYFADFLSAMESGEAIPLHNGGGDWHGVPSSIKLPKNLFVVGTVNIDETTYMFSPKVLDRANVIEFRVTEDEMSKYLDSATKLDLDSLTSNGASMGASFVEIANDKSLTPKNTKELNKELLKFFAELKKSGAEFGYRSASEMNRFAAVVNELEPTWEQWQIVDAAIMQKLLPKVHGSRKKLQPVLEKLAELCLNDPSIFTDYIKNGSDSITSDKIKYPVSMEKIGRMYRALLENSFTSYAEA